MTHTHLRVATLLLGIGACNSVLAEPRSPILGDPTQTLPSIAPARPPESNVTVQVERPDSALQNLLTSQNYESFVHSILGHVAKRIEALLLQKQFNQLGGLLLEKDVRNMVSYTSALSQRTVRDKFARLSQMATLLNLESPAEVLDYWGENAESMMWRLSPFEVKRVLKLRVEFRDIDVDDLDLA